MKKILFFIFLLILFSVQANAIKISYQDFNRVVYFEPNLKKDFVFTISEAERQAIVELELKGEMARYASIEPSVFNLNPGQTREVVLKLNLPAELPKGVHNLEIAAVEKPAVVQQGAFILMPAVGVAVKIVNTDSKDACSLVVFNPEMTSTALHINLNAANNGVNIINGAYAEFALFDSEDVSIAEFKSSKFSIVPFESFSVKPSYKLDKLAEGYYTVRGKLFCAGMEFPFEKKILNPGTDLKIHDFRAYKKDGFFYAEFDVENEFAVPISANGIISFVDSSGKTVRNYGLKSGSVAGLGRRLFQFSKKLSWLEVPAGAYTVKGSLAYVGKKNFGEAKIVLTEDELRRTDESSGGGFSVIAPEKQKKAVLEQPSASFSIDGKMIVRLIAALIIIVLLVIIYQKYVRK